MASHSDVDVAVARLQHVLYLIRSLPPDGLAKRSIRHGLADWIEAGCAALAETRQQLAALKRDGKQADRVAMAAIRDAVTETIATQRERDAQIMDARADVLADSDHLSTMRFDDLIYELRAGAAAIRAARTPQEPTGVED